MKLNKKVLGIGLASLMAISCTTGMYSNKTVKETYSCGVNNTKVSAEYTGSGDSVRLYVNNQEIDMVQKRAASGSYYEGYNKMTSFHTNGKIAVLNVGNGDVNCEIIK